MGPVGLCQAAWGPEEGKAPSAVRRGPRPSKAKRRLGEELGGTNMGFPSVGALGEVAHHFKDPAHHLH